MSAKKPLVFVLPLTESLSKLKQAVEEVIDELDVEIFEVDEIMEINQLLPTIGQAVILFSSPKKCALSLQANKKFIHKLHSKVLLLSPTNLPRKTVDKFTKLGLTEFIPEPVNPKTLMFKVKMLINTIVIKEDNEEEEKVFSQNDAFTKSESTGEKQRVEKGILAEEDSDEEDIYAKDKKEKMLEISSDDDDTKKKNKYQEDTIATHWSSKKKASIELDNIEDDEEEKKKKRVEENTIDSYYKGNVKKDEITLNFDDEESKKKNNHFEDDEDIYKLKESAGLNITSSDDEDEDDIRRSLQLEIQDEKHKRKENGLYDDEEDEKNGKKNRSLLLEEDSSHNNKKKQTELETEEDKSKKRKGFQDRIDDEYMSTKDSAQSLQLDEDGDSKRKEQSEDEFENEKKKRELEKGFNLEDEEDPNNAKKKNKELQLKDEKERNDSLHEEEKERKRKKEEQLLLDEEDEKRKKKATELTTLADNNRNNEQEGLDLDALDDEQQNQHEDKQLDVKPNDESENENALDLEADDEDQHNGALKEIENSEKEKKDKEKSLNLEEDDSHGKKKKKEQTELEFEKDKYKAQDKEKELNKKNNQGNGLNIEDEDNGPKIGKSSTEHIKTYMDSREGIKHKQYDWNLKKDEKGSTFNLDKKDKKNNVEINFKEKVDLGEQTIDYGQLKKEFEDISIYGSGGTKKKLGAEFIGDDNAETEKTNVLYPSDLLEKYDLPIPAENLQDDVVIDRFFKVESHGIEVALKVLARYEQRKNNFEDNIIFIAEELFLRFGAHLEFYQTEHGQSSPKKIYSHYNESKLFEEDFLKNKEIELKTRINELGPFNIPTWKDDKFLTETNTFYFPYLEGVEKLGYALIDFPKGTNDLAKKEQGVVIETMIESLRGFVLDRYHGGNERLIEFETRMAKKEENQDKGKDKDQKPQAKVLSFFNKWFKGKSA
ncbi:hypothetical protein M899_0331 [Bacteriovorax sp. BSW11_IV]|uniref:hypothetical protein n=1 Tax=Bacteriovorax sp. BSW11_IV TaxID=1353529 RepID=UPI00038A23BE|nr:hypothetical protein [Bacteriovorax sp. BSW11_IV]EQC50285.1 hypothetical protein M899_0331 [Bacteriovorax sp. BSW11_IV]